MKVSMQELIGKTIKKIEGLEHGSDEATFSCSDGSVYKMYHDQDCCESVWLEDVGGDPNDLLNAVIFDSRSESSEEGHPEGYVPEYGEWTFFIIRTAKGTVTIRWYGESNGYYSTSASLVMTSPPTP